MPERNQKIFDKKIEIRKGMIMAYFANVMESEHYEAKYCHRCVHYIRYGLCPILYLHALWNYDACNGEKLTATPIEKVKHRALNTLWPRVYGNYNSECKMFYEDTPK